MRVTVAITGASGSIYAIRLLDRLIANSLVERVYVVASAAGRAVCDVECGGWVDNIRKSEKVEMLDNDNFFVPIASGSSCGEVMVVVPCSMGTMGRVATGVSMNLIERAADVQLKERKKLIVVPRETPMSLIHLRNMVAMSEAGAVVLPAMPSFYSGADSVEKLADTVVERILDQMGLQNEENYRWAVK